MPVRQGVGTEGSDKEDHEKADNHDKERVSEITEEIAIKLSFTIRALKKGDMVKIVYYDGESECYVAKTGVVTKIETEERKITVVKTVIYFDDIYDLARI